MLRLFFFFAVVASATGSEGSIDFAKSEGPKSQCLNGPCRPGNEFCGKPFQNAPVFHLMDQHGCGENDPNGPVFDPVHGVIHHFYQIHLAASPGHGPDYGHFVSKDFVNWAPLPVAIWNGLDSSVTPPKVTPYDNEAIFTGSAFVLEGAGPGGTGPGVVNIYPGLCNKHDWPACKTGTVLAQAVPADYANDVLLVNWTKPSYNPIMENTQRDPSSPWKTPSGEWRLRTYDSKVYAAKSDADVLAGKWYEVGSNPDFRTCECPSFYPLPESTPGFEADYKSAKDAGSLPTHVHKTSCGGDWWQLGTYRAGAQEHADEFKPTPGYEDLYTQKRIDAGAFYASKDNEYPTKAGGKRRINWGWATVKPASTQSLPRVITFNAKARTLEQAPIEELQNLRGEAIISKTNIWLVANRSQNLEVPAAVARQSEIIATFALPGSAAKFGITFTGTGKAASLVCTIDYKPPSNASAPFYEVPVECGSIKDTLRVVPSEETIELRVFSDWTFIEAYFQKGRVAMTANFIMNEDTGMSLTSSLEMTVKDVTVYPMKTIWTSVEAVRNAPRVYPASASPEEILSIV